VIVRLSARAERDLRRLDPPTRLRIAQGMRALQAGAPNLDVKALKGSAPWWRLRVGEHRVLCRTIEGGWLVERIVDRRDLERAVRSLQ
jgi:mRNA-degrading endonuclease RelE of RelBE toxin-antitoxin system